MHPVFHYVLMCMATAACAMTISKMKVALPLHTLAERWGQVWLQNLLSCPYCLCFWFALFWTVVTQAADGVVGAIFGSLAVMGGAVLAGGAMMRIMFLHEKELYGVRERMRETREELDRARLLLDEGSDKISDLQEATDALDEEIGVMRADRKNLDASMLRLIEENSRLRRQTPGYMEGYRATQQRIVENPLPVRRAPVDLTALPTLIDQVQPTVSDHTADPGWRHAVPQEHPDRISDEQMLDAWSKLSDTKPGDAP